MATNVLDIDERVRIGKGIEARIIHVLNTLEPTVGGVQLSNWQHSSLDEDKHAKIDAWVDTDDGPKSVQIKYRETGVDLGIATLRPWEGNESFLWDYNTGGELSLDRDMQTVPGYYVCASAGWVVIVPGLKAKLACGVMLRKLAEAGGFLNGATAFNALGCAGAQLRLVRDKGQGYSQDQWKVICYIEPWLLVEGAGATILKVDI